MIPIKRSATFFVHSLLCFSLILALPVQAQWLDFTFPGIPRTADGNPDLDAPTPKTPDGKPDLSGIWFANVEAVSYCADGECIMEERIGREQINMGRSLPDGLPYTEWSREQMAIRTVKNGREDPHTYCMPPNFPRAWTLPQYMKIVQTPQLIVVLHEFNAAYRQIFMDGRELQEDPNPTWNGYSVAHWEDDALVVTTNGLRDDMWLDLAGSPVTETALVTERITRPTFGIMQIELTVDDPKAYTEPWTITIEMAIQADTMLLDEICLDNEQDTDLYLYE